MPCRHRRGRRAPRLREHRVTRFDKRRDPWLSGACTPRGRCATLVVAGSSSSLALSKIKIVVALVFLSFIIAATMPPASSWLQPRARLPRGAAPRPLSRPRGIVTLVLSIFVPRRSTMQAGDVELERSTSRRHSTRIKHDILAGLDKRPALPAVRRSSTPRSKTKTAFEVLVGIFFMFAVGAYWIFERDRTIGLVQSIVPPSTGESARDTWVLIDQKLARVRARPAAADPLRRSAALRVLRDGTCRTGC